MASNGTKYVFLVEFAVRYDYFQYPELQSVFEMFEIEDIQQIPLPQPDLTFHRPFLMFALPLTSKWVPKFVREGNDEHSGDIGSLILDRCTLVRSVTEVWGSDPTLEACVETTIQWTRTNSLGQRIFRHCSDESQSWKCTVHTLGAKYTREEQDTMRLRFSALNNKGPVRMKEPHQEYVLIREVQLSKNGSPDQAQSSSSKSQATAWYYGRALGACGSKVGRLNGKLNSYSLKKRCYLGPTSMDAELSSIMTNLGKVRRGQLVLDPFCGTGSILLSCAFRGAFCVGTDIDIRVLRGKSKDENVFANFAQYNLPRPELIRCDNHCYKRHWRLTTANFYDAIICDPPYGIRAGARKSGSKRNVIKPVVNRHDHIAQTQPYDVSEVLTDLLDLAALALRMNGRLVYVIADDDTHKPQHPCLLLKYSCFQPLNEVFGRRFVVLEKVKQPEPSDRESTHVLVNANLREKIKAVAKQKPHYAEKAAIRKEKRKHHRLVKKVAKKQKDDTNEKQEASGVSPDLSIHNQTN